MKIDYSQSHAWHTCPALWQEKYMHKREFDWDKLTGGIGFGKRIHQLLEEYYLEAPEPMYPAAIDATEIEAQEMFRLYKKEYAEEKVHTRAVEKFFEVILSPEICPNCMCALVEVTNGKYHSNWVWKKRGLTAICYTCGQPFDVVHSYVGKVDWIRITDLDTIVLTDHKSEPRGGKDNTIESWATRPQMGLYTWAMEQIYRRRVEKLEVNILTRQSEKGKMPASFRRIGVDIDRNMIQESVQDLRWVADTISNMQDTIGTEPWPKDRDRCMVFGYKCKYYDLHLLGESPETLSKFKVAEDYLGGANAGDSD